MPNEQPVEYNVLHGVRQYSATAEMAMTLSQLQVYTLSCVVAQVVSTPAWSKQNRDPHTVAILCGPERFQPERPKSKMRTALWLIIV